MLALESGSAEVEAVHAFTVSFYKYARRYEHVHLAAAAVAGCLARDFCAVENYVVGAQPFSKLEAVLPCGARAFVM